MNRFYLMLPAPQSDQRSKQGSKKLKSQEIEVPLVIGGQEIKTGDMGEMRIPHDHQHLIRQIPTKQVQKK